MVALRPIQVVALHHVHAKISEHGLGSRIFNKLGNRSLPKPTRHVRDRFDEHLIVAIGWEIAHKQPVDLDDLHLQVLEIRERG